jgi:hypothetical protein
MGSVSVPRSKTWTQYWPASAAAVICGDVLPAEFTDTARRHPPPVVLGKPMPSPTVAPAPVNVTVIVPDALTVNERLLVPPGASTLDHVSFIVELVVGEAGVLVPSPQPRVIAAKDAIAIHFMAITGA